MLTLKKSHSLKHSSRPNVLRTSDITYSPGSHCFRRKLLHFHSQRHLCLIPLQTLFQKGWHLRCKTWIIDSTMSSKRTYDSGEFVKFVSSASKSRIRTFFLAAGNHYNHIFMRLSGRIRYCSLFLSTSLLYFPKSLFTHHRPIPFILWSQPSSFLSDKTLCAPVMFTDSAAFILASHSNSSHPLQLTPTHITLKTILTTLSSTLHPPSIPRQDTPASAIPN